MILYMATSNRHKIEELQKILDSTGVEVRLHPEYGRLEVEETGTTFQENAALKACALSELCDEYVIADDSGISVDALKGAPGIYSARYAGVQATDEENNRLLLKNLEGIQDRAARFVCSIALAKNSETVKIFTGECKGKVAFSPVGENGFGYDPLFLLDDGRTMAQLTPEEKNFISHRKKASLLLADYFAETGISLNKTL